MYPFTHIPLKSIWTDTQMPHLVYLIAPDHTAYIYQISALKFIPSPKYHSFLAIQLTTLYQA